jgi:26S proteasome regulatory subunit N1
MSDEDRQLKDDLSMLVQRLSEPDHQLYLPSLESLRTQIRSATTSMTSVPKPLKFLREHYDTLRSLYEKMPSDETKRFIADIISILSMTMSTEKYGSGECLKYRLLGSREEIGTWGHEYVRHLAGEVALDWQQGVGLTQDRSNELIRLVKEIVPYHMKHNAEAEAADLLMEIERLDLLDEHVSEEDICNRVCVSLIVCCPVIIFD